MATNPSINPQSNFGSFVTSTNIWDVQQLQQLDIDPKLKELLVRLYQNINNISISLNTRDAGYYVQEEFLNGQIYYPNPALDSTTSQSPTMRQVFRLVVDFGAMPNAGTKSVAHNIDIIAAAGSYPGYSFTRIYGAATKPTTSFIPIPFSSPTLNENIKLEVDTTNVTITTAIDYSLYTICYIVLEFIKS